MFQFKEKFSFKHLHSRISSFHLSNYVNPQQARVYLLSVLILSLALVVLYVPIRIHKMHDSAKKSHAKRTLTIDEIDFLLKKPSLSDLAFPENIFDFAPKFITKSDQTYWSSDMLKKYWLDPSTVGISKLAETNQQCIEAYLEQAMAEDKYF